MTLIDWGDITKSGGVYRCYAYRGADLAPNGQYLYVTMTGGIPVYILWIGRGRGETIQSSATYRSWKFEKADELTMVLATVDGVALHTDPQPVPPEPPDENADNYPILAVMFEKKYREWYRSRASELRKLNSEDGNGQG